MKAKKKPIVLDVWQVSEDDDDRPDWVVKCIKDGMIKFYFPILEPNKYYAAIETPEGNMEADIGDYIVKGTKGEIWPVRKDSFEETYDIVEE